MPSSRRRPAARVRVRRAPHLVLYWRDRELVVENYRTGSRVAAGPGVVELLASLEEWTDPASLTVALPAYDRRSVAGALAHLVRRSIVERARRRSDASRSSRSDSKWAAWHPEPGLLHFSSKDLTYQEFARSSHALRAQARRRRRPPAVKRYPDAPSIALPLPSTSSEFPQVLLARRTWRRFSSRAVSLEALGTLLGLSSRVQYWANVPGIGRLPLKTYPSGGAQHPLEVYVLARRIAGLGPGLYHYASDAHRLERLTRGASGQQIVRYLPAQTWYRSAAALVIITAVFPRTQWKYQFPRAYRAVLTEAGHLCQNLCLTATWLGLAPFCSLALADSVIERDLGIDGVSESVLYAAGVGARPPDADWAPWPTRQRRIRRKPNRSG